MRRSWFQSQYLLLDVLQFTRAELRHKFSFPGSCTVLVVRRTSAVTGLSDGATCPRRYHVDARSLRALQASSQTAHFPTMYLLMFVGGLE